ncbi:MAG: sarcosine oxidase subunit gamma [Rhodobacterales bacterium]|nr:MAG: sarcosine oxidase subunit gamma [Rhodobacterales bacterium]
MSEAISAVPGAAFDGIATVKEAGLVGMITLRGDLGSKKFASAVKKVTRLTVPGQREVVRKDERAIAWMSPDELLLVLPYEKAEAEAAALVAALGGEHSLVQVVSDARAVFDITGAAAPDVLAKLMPVDFSTGAFPENAIRRSRMAQVPAAVWHEGEGLRVVCFRSVGDYAFGVLSAAAAVGSEVGHLG